MSDYPEQRGWHLAGGIAEARAALLVWVNEAGSSGRVFLQAHLSAIGPGFYRVRHLQDAARAENELQCSRDPYAARAIAQTTDSGEHRPLKTAPTLKRGWSLEPLDARGLWIALDYLYPACSAHWYAGAREKLRVTHWMETASRQSGMYSAVGLLPEPAVRNVVRACCGDPVCLRDVAWGFAESSPDPLATNLEQMVGVEARPRGDALVPCPEACSMFISLAKRVLTMERSPTSDLQGLEATRNVNDQQMREIVSAAGAGEAGGVREGDFADEANTRRARYLVARLLTEEK